MARQIVEDEKSGVVTVDDLSFDGYVADETCPRCSGTTVFFDIYYAHCCPECNQWLERHCTKTKCMYCRWRPQRPFPESKVQRAAFNNRHWSRGVMYLWDWLDHALLDESRAVSSVHSASEVAARLYQGERDFADLLSQAASIEDAARAQTWVRQMIVPVRDRLNWRALALVRDFVGGKDRSLQNIGEIVGCMKRLGCNRSQEFKELYAELQRATEGPNNEVMYADFLADRLGGLMHLFGGPRRFDD